MQLGIVACEVIGITGICCSQSTGTSSSERNIARSGCDRSRTSFRTAADSHDNVTCWRAAAWRIRDNTESDRHDLADDRRIGYVRDGCRCRRRSVYQVRLGMAAAAEVGVPGISCSKGTRPRGSQGNVTCSRCNRTCTCFSPATNGDDNISRRCSGSRQVRYNRKVDGYDLARD